MTDLFPADARYADALPPLRGPRLRLRALTDADDPAVVRLFSDAESLKTWVHPPFTSLDDARAYRSRLEQGFHRRSLFVWGVFSPEGPVPAAAAADAGPDGPLVGTAILTRWAPIHRRVDLGYYLGSAWWGRGYATEAARALAGFAFDTLDVHRVEAEIVPGHDASARVLERAGFRFEARLQERLGGDDGPIDSMLYRLLRPEFER